MAEPTFRTLEILVQLFVVASGNRITYLGEENIPETGGAVIAINHTSYVDWAPAALAMYRRHRRMRFMIKAEMQQVKIVNFLIKHSRNHPGGPRRRGRCLRGGRAAAARGGSGRGLSGGHDQPQLRAQGVQDRGRPDGARSRRPDRPPDRLGCATDLDQGPSEKSRSQQRSDHRLGGGAVARRPTTLRRPMPRCASR